MSETANRDDVLSRFRRDLDAAYGPRLERAILFGSRARGDATAESDFDVAVFLHEPAELWDELGRLSHITTRILDETGALISASPFPAGAYHERSPLMQEIRADGVDL